MQVLDIQHTRTGVCRPFSWIQFSATTSCSASSLISAFEIRSELFVAGRAVYREGELLFPIAEKGLWAHAYVHEPRRTSHGTSGRIEQAPKVASNSWCAEYTWAAYTQNWRNDKATEAEKTPKQKITKCLF